jgi:hypothetical protein
MPADPSDHWIEWPVVNRAQLAICVGYTGTSGSITRVMNGIREGSSSGSAHPGLLGLGLVVEDILDIDGLLEVNYRATPEGVRAYQAYLSANGDELPEVKDAATCTNDRYMPQAEALGGEERGGR